MIYKVKAPLQKVWHALKGKGKPAVHVTATIVAVHHYGGPRSFIADSFIGKTNACLPQQTTASAAKHSGGEGTSIIADFGPGPNHKMPSFFAHGNRLNRVALARCAYSINHGNGLAPV